MENKNTIRTFCGWKTSKKKKDIQPHQNFTDSYKKSVEALDELEDKIIPEGKGKQIVAKIIQSRLG